jgi:hypothetical protein
VIQQVAAFQVGQLVFPTLQEAQQHEIEALFPVKADACGFSVDEISTVIVANTDEVVAILTCQPRTKKPRSDKGKKRSKKETIPAVL